MLLCISQTITAAASKLMAARGLGEGEGEEEREMESLVGGLVSAKTKYFHWSFFHSTIGSFIQRPYTDIKILAVLQLPANGTQHCQLMYMNEYLFNNGIILLLRCLSSFFSFLLNSCLLGLPTSLCSKN